jgi:hypothetical protein
MSPTLPQSKSLLNFTTRFVLVIAVLLSLISWLRFDVTSKSLNPDEVVWVLDAEAYSKYREGAWDFFSISSDYDQVIADGWAGSQYRVVDQPQAGKYIIGFLLSVADLKAWQSSEKESLYKQFLWKTLTDEVPQNVVGEAIFFVRESNTYFAVVVFAAMAVCLYWYTKKIEAGMLLLLVLLSNRGLMEYATNAIVDVYSWLFQLLAVVSLYVGLMKLKTVTTNGVVRWAVAAGAATALATSVKLNGAFLIFIPYLIFVSYIGKKILNKQSVSREVTLLAAKWLLGFVVSGVTTFLLLEPELWANPIQNTHVLLEVRIMQQQRFLDFFETLNLLQIAQKMIATFFELRLSAIIVAVVVFGKEMFLQRKKGTIKPLFLSLFLAPIIVATFYYGRVGFDRYFYPATISLYAVVINCILNDAKHFSKN